MSEQQQRPKPVNYDELYPGRFLKAGQLKNRDVTLRINAVDTEEMPRDDGTKRTRGILSFERTTMQMVLNSTNGQCIKAMFGEVLVEWIGKRITWTPETTKFGRKTVGCIRVAGSPDMDQESMIVEIQMPRKRPIRRTLRRTGGKVPSRPDLADPELPEREPTQDELDAMGDAPPED